MKLVAEFIGAFWLVFGGCGSAIIAAMSLTKDVAPVNLGIGFVGVALAFGLTVLTMALPASSIPSSRARRGQCPQLPVPDRSWEAQRLANKV